MCATAVTLPSAVVLWATAVTWLVAIHGHLTAVAYNATILPQRRSPDRRLRRPGLRSVGALFFVPFGVLTVLADLQLGNIWYVTDLVNILVASANVPIILVGGKHVVAALRHYERTGGKEGFVSERDIGLETPYWTERSLES